MKNAEIVLNDVSGASFKWPHIPISVWIALTGAYCMYVIHLTGKMFHETYLIFFGIDPNLFPRSLDEIAVLGQVVFLEKSTWIFLEIADAIGVNWSWILIGSSFYFFAIFSIRRRFPKGAPVSQRIHVYPWLKDLGKGFLLTTLIILPMVYLSACWLLMAWLPVPLGQSAGSDRYKKDMEIFKQGCKAATQQQQCVQLLKANKLALAEGFLIDSSSNHVALYDVNLKQVRAVERAGTELRVLPISIN